MISKEALRAWQQIYENHWAECKLPVCATCCRPRAENEFDKAHRNLLEDIRKEIDMICQKCNNAGVLNTCLGKDFYYCRTCKDEIFLEVPEPKFVLKPTVATVPQSTYIAHTWTKVAHITECVKCHIGYDHRFLSGSVIPCIKT